MLHQQKKDRLKTTAPFHTFLKSPILALSALWCILFRFLRKRLTNRHTGFNRWTCFGWLHFGTEILKAIGSNQIIVLIVHIVTQCMNDEAKPFSLFNATQILGIPIGETQAEKSAVVFIVLIVLIVTLFLNEAKSFSLFNATQILSIQITETPTVVIIVLIVHIVTLFLSEEMSFSLIKVVQI